MLAVLCPDYDELPAKENNHNTDDVRPNAQSLFYLRHLRSCAACAVGCRGGQCWRSATMVYMVGERWVDAIIDGAGSIIYFFPNSGPL